MDVGKKIEQKLAFSVKQYQQIMQLIGQIDYFNGNWKAIEHQQAQHLKTLSKVATIESIGSSTRIEGSTLTDKEVEKLLKSVKITKLKTRDEQEVIGYYEALQIIIEHYADIELSERYIHQLHSILLKHSSKDQHHKGNYKTLSNQVVANYPDGTKRIIFNPTPPHLTAKEMRECIQWVSKKFLEKDMHPLLATACFVYEFLSIHPYKDGNGRLSRLLTTLLLLQQGYHFIQYISFENIVETQKEHYYKALMDGQKHRHKKIERIDKWIHFFLDSLCMLTQRLQAKYDTYTQLKHELNERQQKVIRYIKKKKTVQIKDIEKKLTDYSRNTLKKDLLYLVNEGLLLKTGEGRGVYYHYIEQ